MATFGMLTVKTLFIDQMPTPAYTLSSDSEPSPSKSSEKVNNFDPQRDSKHKASGLLEGDEDLDEPLGEDAAKSEFRNASHKKTPKSRLKVGDETPAKRRKRVDHKKGENKDDEKVEKEGSPHRQMETHAPHHSVWDLSSDSESDSDTPTRRTVEKKESSDLQLKEEENGTNNEKYAQKAPTKGKSPKKQLKEDPLPIEKKETNDRKKRKRDVGDLEAAEEGTLEKHIEPHVSSSILPLVLPEKVHRSKALVECEGESIDLSGDVGAVGRVIMSDTPSKDQEMLLDLKGTIYKTIIVPSRTFCVVSIGQSEAKIEAIMNDFIQLKPQSNVYDAETMVEGTLEGFSFDSEDEADKISKANRSDQNEDAEEQPGVKTKGKADKKSAAGQKKGKAAAAKQTRKKKPQAQKKGKARK